MILPARPDAPFLNKELQKERNNPYLWNMNNGKDYIATWFYREGPEDCSFYPQAGGRGDSELLHSVYMKIQVPFFTTFRICHPEAHMLFFTNLKGEELPPFLKDLFKRCEVETVTLAYTRRPPKGWYKQWANQFYLYDMLKYMEGRMDDNDTLTVCDADCLCRRPLKGLLSEVRRSGSALYLVGNDTDYTREKRINGTSPAELETVYTGCYGEKPHHAMHYYGGEFLSLRADVVRMLNAALPKLWNYNFSLPAGTPRLHEEAHMLSVLAERLNICNNTAGHYVKRIWTGHIYNNVKKDDLKLAVWHLPAEKKTGLYLLYRKITRDKGIRNPATFWTKAASWCGLTTHGYKKRLNDILIKLAKRTLWRGL